MKIQINIIPAENFESKSYKNALAYSEGDDRMLVGEVADMIDSIKKELGNVKLVDTRENDDKSVWGIEPVGWINCMWCGGATYAIYQGAGSHQVKEVKEVVIEVINPQYANMSAAKIEAAEQNYDNLNNEGGEGYNPYRDNLTVLIKKETKTETTINQTYLRGKTGRIFIARKGNIMVFLLDNGESWFTNCAAPSSTITKGPVPDYWIHSIGWSGNFSDYFTFTMAFDTENKQHYPKCAAAESLTPERIAKLKANATSVQI